MIATDFTVTNSSRSTCSLHGWAQVRLYGDATVVICVAGESVPHCPHPLDTTHLDQPTPQATGTTAQTWIVRPGQYESFSLVWQAVGICDLPAYSVGITIPGARTATRIVVPDEPCVRASGVAPMSVTALGVLG